MWNSAQNSTLHTLPLRKSCLRGSEVENYFDWLKSRTKDRRTPGAFIGSTVRPKKKILLLFDTKNIQVTPVKGLNTTSPFGNTYSTKRFTDDSPQPNLLSQAPSFAREVEVTVNSKTWLSERESRRDSSVRWVLVPLSQGGWQWRACSSSLSNILFCIPLVPID